MKAGIAEAAGRSGRKRGGATIAEPRPFGTSFAMASAEAMRVRHAAHRAGSAALALSRGQGQCGEALSTGRRTPARRVGARAARRGSFVPGIGESAMKKAIYVALGLVGLV